MFFLCREYVKNSLDLVYAWNWLSIDLCLMVLSRALQSNFHFSARRFVFSIRRLVGQTQKISKRSIQIVKCFSDQSRSFTPPSFLYVHSVVSPLALVHRLSFQYFSELLALWLLECFGATFTQNRDFSSFFLVNMNDMMYCCDLSK